MTERTAKKALKISDKEKKKPPLPDQMQRLTNIVIHNGILKPKRFKSNEFKNTKSKQLSTERYLA